jgi:auxin-responsive protein IAA
MRRPLSELPEFRRAAAAAPVVGWPPVRAFRRNLASSSSKLVSHEPSSQRGSDSAGAAKAVEAGKKGLFVKINMDGVPIGRKLDLRAHAGYDTLSAAVDHLFRGLLAGMRCLILVFTALYLRNL